MVYNATQLLSYTVKPNYIRIFMQYLTLYARYLFILPISNVFIIVFIFILGLFYCFIAIFNPYVRILIHF